MARDPKKINCPNCGSPLDIIADKRAKTTVCPSCGSQLDLTSPTFAILSNVVQPKAPPRTPIDLGMRGDFRNASWLAIGRIRYREDEYFWDEWLLSSDDGEYLWLTEGEQGWTLYDPVFPEEPPDPSSVGGTLRIDGKGYTVRARGDGIIDFIEGEMTWKAVRGDIVRYIDAESGNLKAAIEYTENEVEYFVGQKMAPNEVRTAFGLPLIVAPKGRAPTLRDRMVSYLILGVIVVICVCCVLAFVGDATGGGEDTEASSGPSWLPFPLPSGSFGSGSSSSGGSFRGGGSSRSGGGGSSSGGGGK